MHAIKTEEMTTQEELAEFKRLVEKQEIRRSRVAATTMGISSIIALISVVFGLFQYQTNKDLLLDVNFYQKEAQRYKIQSEKAAKELSLMEKNLDAAMTQAQKAVDGAQKNLSKLK